jgi:uncharacterized protein (DUF2236 family)
MPAAIRLPLTLQRRLEAASTSFLHPIPGNRVDFSRPAGEAALVPPDSVSWRIFKNPLSLFIGGVAAVLLELADPAVRTGVWEQSTFRRDPLGRLRRTGLAAMVTIYGPRSVSQPMIAGIVRMHSRVNGTTPDGHAFAANDPGLLTWVHATATFGFVEAYCRYVAPLGRAAVDCVYREGAPTLALYGAANAPQSQAAATALFEARRGRLEPSPIVFKFLEIMAQTPAFPPSLAWLQPLLVRAAVDLLPDWVRVRLELTEQHGLRRRERWMVQLAGALADRIVLKECPAAQSCIRLGLPATYLYTGAAHPNAAG